MARKESTNLPIAGLATAAIAAAAVLFVGDTPYLEIRPSQKQVVDYDRRAVQRVDARLWQDPFAAVGDFEKKEGLRLKSNADSEKNEATARSLAPMVIGTSPGNGYSPFLANRFGVSLCSIFDKISALARPDKSPSDKNQELGSRSTPPLTILAVTMQASPSVGGEETRRRERYAVVSALGAADFVPDDDEHIGYLVLHQDDLDRRRFEMKDGRCHVLRDNATTGDDTTVEDRSQEPVIRLPFEVFDKGKNSNPLLSENVLVLWVDESVVFDDSRYNWLTQFQQMIKQMAPCLREKTCEVRVIGPSSSDAYAKLAAKGPLSSHGDDATDDKMLVYSPFVTSNVMVDNDEKAVIAHYATIIPTIPNDDVVFGGLVGELRFRSIPLCGTRPGGNKPLDSTNEIVLLSEWDTEYGRRAKATLQAAIEKQCAGQTPANVRQFSFLRGLDGAVVGGLSSPAQLVNTDNPHPTTSGGIEWPENSDQRDYIRRTGERIVDLQKNPRLNIQAIGIIASDTHDKLLLLQALRQKFPELPFFTTDADARLAHPTVHRWTSNLIVASGYGLSLREQLQERTPPFRDVYQTSTYLATLLAIQVVAHKRVDDNIIKDWTQHYEVFEVGRSRLVRLVGKDEWVSQPPSEQDECAVGSLELCTSVVNTEDRRPLKPTQQWVVMLLVLGFAAEIGRRAVRTYSFGITHANGRSGSKLYPWPARFLLAMLLLALSGTVMMAASAVGVLRAFDPGAGVLTEGVSSLPVALCWSIALSTTIYFQLRMVATGRSRFSELEASYLGSTVALPKLNITDGRRNFFVWAWSELFDEGRTVPWGATAGTFVETWTLYKYHSYSGLRIGRILVWWCLIYWIPLFSLLPWLPYPQFPIRAGMHLIIEILAPVGFMLLMLLMAMVADTVLLCCIFVTALGRRRNVYPDDVQLAAVGRYALLPDLRANVDSLLDTEVIGKRTSIVADTLYYPFIVMSILCVGLFASLEHWARWPGRFVVVGLNLAVITGLWLLLRWSTEHARAEATAELDTVELRVISAHAKKPHLRNALCRQCRLLKRHISAAREGAYAALLDQPIVKAFLLPIGGAGAAQVWQYLSSRLG
jgi:hypothetical protein